MGGFPNSVFQGWNEGHDSIMATVQTDITFLVDEPPMLLNWGKALQRPKTSELFKL